MNIQKDTGVWQKLTTRFAATVLTGAMVFGGSALAADPPSAQPVGNDNNVSAADAVKEAAKEKEIIEQLRLADKVWQTASAKSVIVHPPRELIDNAIRAIIEKVAPDGNAKYINNKAPEEYKEFFSTEEELRAFKKQKHEHMNLYDQILEQAQRYANEEYSIEELNEVGLKAMMTSLDPHSNYFNAEDWKNIKTSMNGNFVGIGAGVAIGPDETSIKISNVMEGYPAQKAGLQNDDLITAVDGVPVKEIGDLNKVVGKIRGPKGTIVDLTVKRAGEAKPLTFKIERKNVEISPVVTKLVETEKGNIGLIALSQFSAKAYESFVKGVNELKSDPKGAPDFYALDLRNNGGGYVGQVVGIGDELIDSNEEMTHMIERGGIQREPVHARPGDILDGKPLIVLTNRFSASGAEMLPGMLKDLGRARIISSDPQTFGKGSGYEEVNLPGSRGMHVTTFYYATKDGSPHRVGVKPDILVELSEDARPKFIPPENATEEEVAKERAAFEEYMSTSEANMAHVLPSEAALLRKDPPPAKVCAVRPDADGQKYTIKHEDIVSSAGKLDEVFVCAAEKLLGISERATFKPNTPATPTPAIP